MAVAAAEQAGRARRGDAGQGQGLCRRDRQCRPVLRRGHLLRDRLDRADPADAGGLSDRALAARAGGLGDPDRDRRLPDPRRPGCCCSTGAGPRETGGAAMITIQWVFYPGRRDVRGLGAAERARPDQPKRLGNAAFWGLVALSLLAGHLARRFRQRLPGARPRRRSPSLNLIGRGAPATERGGADGGRASGTATGCSCRSWSSSFTAVAGTLLYLYTPLHETGLFEREPGDLHPALPRRAARAGA